MQLNGTVETPQLANGIQMNEVQMTPATPKISDLGGIENDLLNTPAPDRKLTKKDALAQLAPVLKKMKGMGHTNESVAAALAARGVSASPREVARAVAVPRKRATARVG